MFVKIWGGAEERLRRGYIVPLIHPAMDDSYKNYIKG